MPARMCWNKSGLPKPDIQMMVWDDLSWWQEAGAGGVPRGRCCPVNSPPWQRGGQLPGGPSAPALPMLHRAPGAQVKQHLASISQSWTPGASGAGLPAYAASEFYPQRLHSHCSKSHLQGGWQLHEVLSIKKVFALYSGAYFYENPSLVGTSLK